MTVQSSFLIRCSLQADGDSAVARAYSIQHVQTGAEFRAATLGEVTDWIAAQNLRYLTIAMERSSSAEEDLQ